MAGEIQTKIMEKKIIPLGHSLHHSHSQQYGGVMNWKMPCNCQTMPTTGQITNKQLTNQLPSQSSNLSANQQNSQSIYLLISPPIRLPTSQPIYQIVIQPTNKSANQKTHQPIKQQANHTANCLLQPANHPRSIQMTNQPAD